MGTIAVGVSGIWQHWIVNGQSPARISELKAQYDQRLEAQDATHPGYSAAFNSFGRLLLVNGGDLVVPPNEPDILIGPVSEMGVVRSVEALEVRPMSASDCHFNAASLWRAGEVPSVGTGYAMSDDQLWREHSWGVTGDGAIVETIAPRSIYFGFVFEGEDAGWFADWILPADNG